MKNRSLDAIYTIGVYGYEEAAFFAALQEREIDLFVDVRRRRGVRGARYKFVNSSYLQAKLATLGIGYAHLLELAPTPRIRSLQDLADQQQRLQRRSDRQDLCKEYIHEYKRDILRVYKRKPERRFVADDALAMARQLAGIPDAQPVLRPALFCVEGEPQACHRSLAAAEIAKQLGVEALHILAD
ncbi:MAG: DUF488 family protein [Chloroflexi bacterium]|nr:DUF488 family protein [Chloroflexota bacterium]